MLSRRRTELLQKDSQISRNQEELHKFKVCYSTGIGHCQYSVYILVLHTESVPRLIIVITQLMQIIINFNFAMGMCVYASVCVCVCEG